MIEVIYVILAFIFLSLVFIGLVVSGSIWDKIIKRIKKKQ